MRNLAFKIMASGAVALILTVMLGQFRLSWNDTSLLFMGLFAMCYFTAEKTS